MAQLVIDQEEIADLTRRLAEDQHSIRLMKQKLEAVSDGENSPLATLAVMRLASIEAQIETALDMLMRAAPALTSVTSAD